MLNRRVVDSPGGLDLVEDGGSVKGRANELVRGAAGLNYVVVLIVVVRRGPGGVVGSEGGRACGRRVGTRAGSGGGSNSSVGREDWEVMAASKGRAAVRRRLLVTVDRTRAALR